MTGDSIGFRIVYGPYHRLESPTQTDVIAAAQESSGQIWGRAARGSNIATVKAYHGPLPPGVRGIEFMTYVKPHRLTHPTTVQWYDGDVGVMSRPNGFVWIPVSVIRNGQV